jgi:hypothetical protein
MSWRRSVGVVAPLALVAVALAGCGGDNTPQVPVAPGTPNLGMPPGGYVPVVDPMIRHDVSPPLREMAVPPDPDAERTSTRTTPSRCPTFAPCHKGRAAWPATLTNADASYVITPDASYTNGVLFGGSIARLGDFNGDGADDCAIGVPQYAATIGRVVIVLGKTGFGSITLPDAANTIRRRGPPLCVPRARRDRRRHLPRLGRPLHISNASGVVAGSVVIYW